MRDKLTPHRTNLIRGRIVLERFSRDTRTKVVCATARLRIKGMPNVQTERKHRNILFHVMAH